MQIPLRLVLSWVMVSLGKAARLSIGNRVRFSYWYPDGSTGYRSRKVAPRLWR